jgi:predicted DNA-binding transcriptional regulator YafY
MSARDLAAEFEVSVRTIYRDIDELALSGVPVYAEKGPRGGFALLDGYQTRVTGLTAGEAETLSIAGLGEIASELGVSARLRDAQLKLTASVPQANPITSKIGSRLYIDRANWFKRTVSPPLLARIATAVWDQQRMSFHYVGWNATGKRVVEPLGLVLKGADWYVVGLRETQTKIYKISRISELTIHNETFDRPVAFDLRSEWAASVERFEAGLLRYTAILRVRQDYLPRLNVLGASALALAKYGTVSPDGWVSLSLPVERTEFSAEQILCLGAAVEVISPSELRNAVSRVARSVVSLYSD